jgi:hypothetical protein
VKISGRIFADRPPGVGSKLDRAARLNQLCECLEGAAERCTEPERRLYAEIRRVQAMAMNLRDYQRGEALPDSALWGTEPGEANGG